MPRPTGAALAHTVQELRRTIARLRRRGSAISEEDTKRVLVNPLLAALDWDTLDVEEVRSEYRHKPQDNPVDYALFILRTPALFVEAKALGRHLEDRKWVSQTIGYAATVGVEWCVLTTGDEYRLYNAHAAVDAEDKLFRAVKISDETEEPRTVETLSLLSKGNMAEKRLDVLWKVEIVDKRVKAGLEGLITQPDEGLVRLLRKRAHGLSAKDVRTSLGRARVHVDFPVVSLAASSRAGAHPKRTEGGKRATQAGLDVQLSDLLAAGLIATPFSVEATWKKRAFTARILGADEIAFDGKSYSSLSAAAGMARNIASGRPKDGRSVWQTNGWTFWKYLDTGTGQLRPLSDLREKLSS